MPETSERLLLHALRRWFFDDAAQPSTTGNVFEPSEWGAATTHGVRPPLIGTARFPGWNAVELTLIAVGDLTAWARRLRESPA